MSPKKLSEYRHRVLRMLSSPTDDSATSSMVRARRGARVPSGPGSGTAGLAAPGAAGAPRPNFISVGSSVSSSGRPGAGSSAAKVLSRVAGAAFAGVGGGGAAVVVAGVALAGGVCAAASDDS